MRKFLSRLLAAAAMAGALLTGGTATAGTAPNGYFMYDPSVEGMRDLRDMLPIEGCNVPGGLVKITDRDEADSAPYWCGQPPHCLRESTHPVDSCRYVPYCRREPRGDPNGIPGANGCRDPQDLICVSSGQHPEGGMCLKTCWDGSRIPFSQLCPPKCHEELDKDGKPFEVCVQDDVIPDNPPPREPPPTPQRCPDGTPLPPNGDCDSNKKNCPAGEGTYEQCHFSWPTTASGDSISQVPDNGLTGWLTARCENGGWVDPKAFCKVCPDGKPPVNGVCAEPKVCPDGTKPVNGVCPAKPEKCPDGSPMPPTRICPANCADQTVEWEVLGNFCSGRLGKLANGKETDVYGSGHDHWGYQLYGASLWTCSNGTPVFLAGRCSRTAVETCTPDDVVYTVTVTYDYCTKRPEYAGAYQQCIGSSCAPIPPNSFDPRPPEMAFAILGAVPSCNPANGPAPGYPQQWMLDAENQQARRAYCVD